MQDGHRSPEALSSKKAIRFKYTPPVDDMRKRKRRKDIAFLVEIAIVFGLLGFFFVL